MAGPSLEVGQLLGKYRLTEKLGEGAMGVVYAGVHEALGREVAIKLLKATFSKNDEVVTRFQQEAEAVSRIGHANIVAVYDFGRFDDGSLYYVMERIRGETVAARIARQPPMTPDETVSMIAQVCRALHSTHGRNIVHRDLKPDNILLQPQASGMPHVKIVDFGVARMRDPNETDNKLTLSGALLGTPTYMSPEQIATPGAVDGRTDLYALGAILFEVLTGQPPFAGPVMVVLEKHVHAAPPAPSTRTTRTIPPALDAFVLRALSKKPEDRPANAALFIGELEAAWGVGPRRTTQLGTVSATTRGPHSGPQQAVPATTPVSEPRGMPVDPMTETLAGPANAAAAMMAMQALAAAAPVAAAASATPIAVKDAPAPARRASMVPVYAGVGFAALLLAGTVIALQMRKAPVAAAASEKAVAAPAPIAVRQDPLRDEAAKVLATSLTADAPQRRAAVEAMGEVADHASVDQVINALADDNPEVRRAAAVAAIAIGRPSDGALKAALVEAASRSGGAVAVDLAAARLHVGDAAAEEDLRRALEQRDPIARLRAALVLATAGKVAAPMLHAALSGAPATVKRSMRWPASAQLQRMGDAAFAAELRASLGGADPGARIDAAQALGRSGDAEARKILVELVTGAADPIDRVDAAAVLAELADPAGRPALVVALGSPQALVRARAALSLGRLAPLVPSLATPESLLEMQKKLAPMLKDAEPIARVAAASALLALSDLMVPR